MHRLPLPSLPRQLGRRLALTAWLLLATAISTTATAQLIPTPEPAAAELTATPAPEPGTTMVSRTDEVVDKLSQRIGLFLEKHLGQWVNTDILGIGLWRYMLFLATMVGTMVLARIVRFVILKEAAALAKHTFWRLDELMIEAIGDPASLFVHAIGIYAAVALLFLQEFDWLRAATAKLSMTLAAAAVVWYVYRIVDVLDHYLRKVAARDDNDLDDTFVDVVRKALRAGVVLIGVMVISQSILDLKITAVLASAGIIGLAIAFAAQDTIANLFGTLMLMLDKPFKGGERVKVGGADGVVENIGFRSTRIRTLDGHQVTIPNKDVSNSVVENVGRRPHIKRVANITITYDTPPDKVEKAVDIIRTILANHPGMKEDLPPRVYFNDFNDWSLNLIMICWYHPGVYFDFLEWSQEVNLKIMRAFEAEGIEFAFPTNTTYLAGDPKRPIPGLAPADPPPAATEQ